MLVAPAPLPPRVTTYPATQRLSQALLSPSHSHYTSLEGGVHVPCHVLVFSLPFSLPSDRSWPWEYGEMPIPTLSSQFLHVRRPLCSSAVALHLMHSVGTFSLFYALSCYFCAYILRYERVCLKRRNGFPCVFHGSSVSIQPIAVSTADSREDK